jgi:8-oxo-dGTP pyrophosphatase MutT (NUDIX family)
MMYPSAKVIVRSEDNKDMILLVQRIIDEKIYYEPAGGKIDVDFVTQTAESLEECAQREIQEELGVTIGIKGYLGSYYFFWHIDSKKLSICALFEGIIVKVDPEFTANGDSCELPICPVWVSMRAILTGSITINSAYVGLERLIKDYCHKNICEE